MIADPSLRRLSMRALLRACAAVVLLAVTATPPGVGDMAFAKPGGLKGGQGHGNNPPPPLVSDLLPQSITRDAASIVAGGTLHVTWDVKNQGTDAANATSATAVRITASSTDPTGLTLATVETAALEIGATQPQSADVAVPAVAGTYYAWVLANSTGTVTNQSDTANDRAHSVSFDVTPAPPPPAPSDLIAQNIVLGASSVVAGGTLHVTWDVKNQGAGPADATSTAAVRINQSTTSPVGADFATVATVALAEGTMQSESADVTVPAVAGTYYVWVLADSTHAVTNQSDTTNDATISLSFEVTAPVIPPGDETPLSASFTTPAASTFLASCGTAPYPAYPPQFIYDPATIVGNQPQAATEAMGLTPKVEQVRAGVVIATYDDLGGQASVCNVPHRSDNPGTPASIACGPFSAYKNLSYKAGDTFRVYPAVYKKALYPGPVAVGAWTVAVASGGTSVTVPDTSDLTVGDYVAGLASFVPTTTHIASINSPTQITVDKPFLAGGAVALTFYRGPDGLTIEGVTQNVAGVPTRPKIQFSEGMDLTMTQGHGVVYLYGAGGLGDIHNFTMRNIDINVPQPPAGQRYWNVGTGTAMGLIYIGGTQLSGITTFEDMRVEGAQWWGSAGSEGLITGNAGVSRSNSGTMRLTRTEFDHNGGADGPAHNVYGGEGSALTLEVTNSYFHDVVFGHLFKTRLLHNIFKGNYFEGGDDIRKFDNFGESNLIDAACGGDLILVDNIFVKKSELLANNGIMIDYNEGNCDGVYPYSERLNGHIEYRHNTFVAFARDTSGGGGALLGKTNIPMGFKARDASGVAGWRLPGDAAFPTADITVKNNVGVGICPNAFPAWRYPFFTPAAPQGSQIIAALSDLNQSFGLTTNYVPSGNTDVIGEPAYAHRAQGGVTRTLATFGAQDASAGTMPAAVPTVLLYPDNYQPAAGTPVILKWGVTGGGSCTASGGWSGAKATAGTETVAAPVGDTTYTLSCTGPSGTGSDSAEVHPIGPPTLSALTATPATIAAGQSSTVAWASTNADLCHLTNAWFGGAPANSSSRVSPAQTIQYGLFCEGADGVTSGRLVKVTVTGTTEKPTGYIEAVRNATGVKSISNLRNVGIGGSYTLNWGSTAATSCTGSAKDPGTGTVYPFDTAGTTSGTMTLSYPAGPVSIQYSIGCTGAGGTSTTRSVTVSRV